jgi:hypothetical protein
MEISVISENMVGLNTKFSICSLLLKVKVKKMLNFKNIT